MDESVIKIKDVRKVYRMGEEKIVAINNISFDIRQNEVCCLLGKSGSGKSTLLNLIAGLEKPTKGEIIFNKHHIEKIVGIIKRTSKRSFKENIELVNRKVFKKCKK